MKTLNHFISEKLFINKNTKERSTYFPENKEELIKIIKNLIEENKGNNIVDLNCINTSNITDMSCLFELEDIINIDISEWDVSNVTTMYNMFSGCKKLVSVGNLGNWNVEQVQNMHAMFYYCEKLKSIGDISLWNVERVENVWAMFSNCNNLNLIGDLSNWNIHNVSDMSFMFYKCTSLTNIGDLSKWKSYIKLNDISDDFMLTYCPAKKYANL